MRIRTAVMADLEAVTAVEAACFPAAEAAKEQDFLDRLNPNSLTVVRGYAEPLIRDCETGATFQFIRTGYFCKDPDSTSELPVFNRTVELNGLKL